jgi:predicted AlkP superfamily phosphohydrolase/phosphomutase
MPREEQWFNIAKTLLAEDSTDLFAVMFDGTDKLQHQVWHILDPHRIENGLNADDRRLREMTLDYFRTLDRYIERLVDLAGPGAQVFFASDHGFTGSDYVFRLNRYLGDLGYLKWRPSDGSEAARRRDESNFANLLWEETTAYCPTPSSNGVVIRVAAKPGDAGVQPGDYSAFRKKLIEDLTALPHPDGGRPFIREILLREKVFPGAAKNAAPDLTLVLDDYGFVSVKNKTPYIEKRPLCAGTHHPDGIFLAYGPGVEPGDGGRYAIMDVAAVLLYSLGLPIPEDFEAKIPDGLFSPDHLRKNPVRFGDETRPVSELTKPAGEMSEDDKSKMLDQLRALGYLED